MIPALRIALVFFGFSAKVAGSGGRDGRRRSSSTGCPSRVRACGGRGRRRTPTRSRIGRRGVVIGPRACSVDRARGTRPSERGPYGFAFSTQNAVRRQLWEGEDRRLPVIEWATCGPVRQCWMLGPRRSRSRSNPRPCGSCACRGRRGGVVVVCLGLTTGEICAYFAEIYGRPCRSEDLADRRQGDLGDDRLVPPPVGRDLRGGVHRRHRGTGRSTSSSEVKVRGGPAAKGARFWMSVLTDLRNRGVRTCSSSSATG